MANVTRPKSFDEIIGQGEVIERLRISAMGCKMSSSVLPHVLIDGPPGLGKTTIASAIAENRQPVARWDKYVSDHSWETNATRVIEALRQASSHAR
jgi:Holliday junction resolvasome RuvABC ATP-dependent DNA helicase subunit